MRIPKSDFVRFKKKFVYLQDLLSLRGYKIYFKFIPLEDGAVGSIIIDQSSCVATVIFSNRESKAAFDNRPSPEECAAHEIAHLFISKLSYLAIKRSMDQEELEIEEEKLVRILERVLK